MKNLDTRLTDFARGLDATQDPIHLDEVRHTTLAAEPVRTLRPWVAAAGAFGLAIVLGGAVWMIGIGGTVDEIADTVPTTEPLVTTTVALPVTAGPRIGDTFETAEWTDLLATTVAGTTPPMAVCPSGTDPDELGPADQERPSAIRSLYPSAALDLTDGVIVHVDRHGVAWTFDVCTNTWDHTSERERYYREDLPDIGGIWPQLVYDVDSDLTVAFWSQFAGPTQWYDSETDTWTTSADGVYRQAQVGIPRGAVYDPVSGLIVTTALDSDVWAYDVDTDTWMFVGRFPAEIGDEFEIIGYAATLDRVIGVTSVGSDQPGWYEMATALLDPRTGAVEIVSSAPVEIFGWTFSSHGQGLGTVWASAVGTEDADSVTELWAFDPDTLEWGLYLAQPPRVPNPSLELGAIVGDPVNDRLVLIDVWRPESPLEGVWGFDADGVITTLQE